MDNFTTYLSPLYDYVSDKNRGMKETPEYCDILKELDSIWDRLNSLEESVN